METVTFRLLDRKTDESSFFLHQDGTKDTSRKLDFTHSYGILNPFYITEKGGGRKYFRYITGCSIFDPFEQEKQKYVFNQQNGVLEFKLGADIILDLDFGGILAYFLKIHPWNTKSEYHIKGTHEPVFFTYDPKEQVVKDYEIANAEDEAMSIFRDLSKNPERMRAIKMIFAETSGLEGEQEIYIGLRTLAKNKPIVFKESIASREQLILSEVLLSARMEIIQKDAKGWIFKETGGIILPTTTKKQADAENELVTFFMSAEGDIHYRHMMVKKQQKEIEENAPAGTYKPEEVKVDKKGQVTNPELL